MRAKQALVPTIVIIAILVLSFVARAFVEADTDSDGLTNYRERELGTDPSNPDTDNDGIKDGDEVKLGTSPVDFDTDSDGLGDGREVALGTNPKDIDSDDDGLSDGYEVDSSHTNPLVPQGKIVATLKDEETGKPIGRVGGSYPTVVLDGKDQGYVTDYGEFQIKYVDSGIHELKVFIPEFGEVRKFVEVSAGKTSSIVIEIDVPNPEFLVSVTVDYRGLGGLVREYAVVGVTFTNIGEIRAEGTKALVLLYREDNPDSPADSTIFDLVTLGEIGRKDDTKYLEWGTWGFEPGYWEAVAVVVFDKWEFTPQNRQVVSQVQVPTDAQERIVASLLSYAEEHAVEIGMKIAQIIVGWCGQ